MKLAGPAHASSQRSANGRPRQGESYRRDCSVDPERASERQSRRRAGSRGKCRAPRLGPRERGDTVKFLIKYGNAESGWGRRCAGVLCAHINLMPKALGPWGSSQITLATRELGWSLLPPHPVCVCVFSPPVPTSWVSSARGHFEPQMYTVTRHETPTFFALEARLREVAAAEARPAARSAPSWAPGLARRKAGKATGDPLPRRGFERNRLLQEADDGADAGTRRLH